MGGVASDKFKRTGWPIFRAVREATGVAKGWWLGLALGRSTHNCKLNYRRQNMTTEQNGDTDPNGRKLKVQDIYGPLVELVTHGQDNKLNLFSSFLFFQSILLLAWATVWQIKQPGRDAILMAFSVFGIVSSVLWALIGSDYANASRGFSDVAEGFEKLHFEDGIPKFLSARGETVRKHTFGGRDLIGVVTWGFALLYVVLEFVLCKASR